MNGINQLVMNTQGSYTVTITGMKSANAWATFFVRGNPVPAFGDGNYYGHDSCGEESVGCAGIYFSILTAEDGSISLRINVKGGLANGQKAEPHIYTVPMSGYDLTITDDNNTISVYDGETRVAAIQLMGNFRGYAEQAQVTLADGTNEWLSDLAIAADANSDIGFISRSAELKFTGFSITGIDPVEASPVETLPEAPEAGTASNSKGSWDSIYKNTEGTLADCHNGTDGQAAAAYNNAPIALDDSWTTLFVRGWAGSGDANNAIVAYGYRINGSNLVYSTDFYRALSLPAEQPVVDAGGDSRYVIAIPTADLIGGMHYIQGYAVCADGTAIEILNLWIQGTPDPDTTVDVEFNAANEEAPNIQGSDFGSFFMNQFDAAGSPSTIVNGQYLFTDYSHFYATADGYYAFKAILDETTAPSMGAMFVRGVSAFDFGDGGYFGAVFNGSEWTGYAGCAGIYINAVQREGYVNLVIRFHCYDAGTVTVQEYTVRVHSKEITVVDKGDVISILSGTDLAATITISGTKDFGYTAVDADACADIVTIKTAAGVDEVVANAVVAATCNSDIGFASRQGATPGVVLKVSNVSVKPAKTVTIPADLMTEAEPPATNVNKPSYLANADALAALTPGNNMTVTAGDGYTTFTSTGGDPNITLFGNQEYQGPYVVIKYRTTAVGEGQIFVGTTGGPSGPDTVNFSYENDGEWHVIIIDASASPAMKEGGKIGYIRYDFFLDNHGAIDIEYVAIFATEETANAYASGNTTSNEPVHLIPADKLVAPAGCTSATTVLGDGFVTVTPLTDDPNYMIPAGFVGSRYVAVKYRTSTADKCNLQLYLASTGDAPKDDTTMLQLPVIGDGEWHLLIFDLDTMPTKLDAEYFVSYIRLDAIQAGFQTDENGDYIYAEGSTTNILKLPIPAGATIDIAYIAFFNSAEDANTYEYGSAEDEPEKDLTINKTEYAFGEEICVTAKGETEGQWVGLYSINDNYEGGAVASLYWYYINADGHTSGETYVINQLTNNANSDRSDLTHLPAGQYKIILFADGGYTALEQVEFTILPIESTLTTEKTTYALGETININALTMGSTDWVAVYPAGAPIDNQYIGYYYPIGPDVTDALWNKRNGVTVDLNAMLAAMDTPVGPLGVGSYDIYLLADNSYDQVLDKITITITEA